MKNHAPLRILLFESDRILRNTLADYLRAEPDLKLLGKSSNFWDAEGPFRQANPHGIVIDLDLGVHNQRKAENRV